MATVMATAMMITGKEDNDNGHGRRRQWARTTGTARTTSARTTAMMARTTGEDGEDNRQG